jgi:hypothetical protein
VSSQKKSALPGEAGWALNASLKAAGEHKTFIYITTRSSTVKNFLKQSIVRLRQVLLQRLVFWVEGQCVGKDDPDAHRIIDCLLCLRERLEGRHE